MAAFDIGEMKTPPAGLKFYCKENEYEVFARTISLLIVFYAITAIPLIVFLVVTGSMKLEFIGIFLIFYVFQDLFLKLFGWARLIVKDDCIYYTTFFDRLLRKPPIVVALQDLQHIRMTTEESRANRWDFRKGRSVIELKMSHEKVFVTFGANKNAWVSIFLKRVHTAYKYRIQKTGVRDQ